MCLFHSYGKWEEKKQIGHNITMFKECSKCLYRKYKFITEPCAFSGYEKSYTNTTTEAYTKALISKKSISKGNCIICNKEDYDSVYIG